MCSCSTKPSQPPALRLPCSLLLSLKVLAFPQAGKRHWGALQSLQPMGREQQSLLELTQAHACFVLSPVLLFSRLHVFSTFHDENG